MNDGTRYLKWLVWHVLIIMMMGAAFGGRDSVGALHVLYVLVPFLTVIALLLMLMSDRWPLMPMEMTIVIWLGYGIVFVWNDQFALAIITLVRIYLEAVRFVRMEKFHDSSSRRTSR